MPKLKLTQRAIDRLRAPDPSQKQIAYWDTELKGFAVLVSGLTTNRSYIAQRDLPSGKTRRVTLGNVNELTLDEARDGAADLINDMRRGVDPKAGRRGKAGATLREWLDDFLAARKNLRDNSRLSYRTALERHVADWLDNPMRDITAMMVIERHEAIQKKIAEAEEAKRNQREVMGPAERLLDRVLPALTDLKAADRHQLDTLIKGLKRALTDKDEVAIRSRTISLAHAAGRFLPGDWSIPAPRKSQIEHHGQAAANGIVRALRAVWNFALEQIPDFPANPTRAMKKRLFASRRRERVVKAADLSKFYAAVDALPSRTASDYLKLVMFTGLRRREAGSLKWDNIDLINKVIHLGAAATKNKRAFDLPMSSFVCSLLVARRQLGREEYVFASDSRAGWIAEPKFPLTQVAKTCGVDVSIHDLRGTFASVGANTPGVSGLALKRLLNHVVDDVTSGYVMMDLEELRQAAQKVCDRMMHLCQIPKIPTDDKVAVLS